MQNLVVLTVRSTHFYLLECQGGRLLVDAGWSLGEFKAQMKAFGIGFAQIRYVMFTHHHPDHAGLVQDIKDLSGARLIIHAKQIPYLEDLKRFYAKKGGLAPFRGYNPIRVEKGDLVSPGRAALETIGIHGELIETPGHSEDSISLLLDSGEAFIGDLTAPELAGEENARQVFQSWKTLLQRGARMFYHSHTAPFSADVIQNAIR